MNRGKHMNFVFISPNFPHTYWNFCDRLKKNGVNVLGIGDAPYDEMEEPLKACLTEYYKVSSLMDYDQVYRAVGFFCFKYGKIDWVESNNEFWLEQDARLRTDFNITTGVRADQIDFIKKKSLMKKIYQENGIPTARQSRVTTKEDAEAFLEEVGYPVIVKPDTGVGANDTWKLSKKEDLDRFFNELPEVPYVMEEFIEGDICSYDAIIDASGDPLFENMTHFPPSIMDIVLKNLDLSYYTCAEVPAKLQTLGRKTVKAFNVRSRFVHLEFFCLAKGRKGLGRKGDFVALEVNMRPAGGYTPDMINFGHSTDVYQIWADMVAFNERRFPKAEQEQFCAYASRRSAYEYVHSHEEIQEKYGSCIKMQEAMPEMNWPQMGEYMYTAQLPTEEAVFEYIHFVTDRK